MKNSFISKSTVATTIRLLCLIALLIFESVHAQQVPTGSANIKFNRIESIIDVDNELLSRIQVLIEREALTTQGTIAVGKYSKSYSKELESFKIEEAYTLKTDGRRLTVPADQIQKQSGVAAGGTAASMPDVEVIQVTFPDVQVGDRTVIRSVESTLKLPLPGFYSYFDFLPPDASIDLVKFKLTAPKSVNVYVQGKPDEFIEAEDEGRKTWTLAAHSSASSVDDDAKDPYQVLPYFVASNFQSYEDIASAYARQSSSKVKITGEVKKLVDFLIKDQSDTQSKARSIYDWVRRNIRYVALYLGNGGMVPHDVDWILANRYGDCKDHVLLLQVMLKAAGIETAPALINANNLYSFVKLPTLVFDHVITYIPELSIFLDPTALNIPFGNLPFGDQDKPVAVALATGSAIMRTPAGSATQNTVEISSVWRIHSNGDADADIKLSVMGSSALGWQDWLERIPEGMRQDTAMKVLRQSGYVGSAELTFPKVKRESLEQSLSFKIHVKDFLSDPEAGAIVLHPRLSNIAEYIGPSFGYAAETRTYSRTCTPITRTESFEVIFDPAFTVTKVPNGVSINGSDGIKFISEYRLDGNSVRGNRTLVLSHPRNICTPSDYVNRKPTFDFITKHLRKIALYQQ